MSGGFPVTSLRLFRNAMRNITVVPFFRSQATILMNFDPRPCHVRQFHSTTKQSSSLLIAGQATGTTKKIHQRQRRCINYTVPLSRSSSSNSRTMDGYNWPNLYQEARGMAMASFISYPITFILREARLGRLKHSDHLLERLEATHLEWSSNNNSKSSSSHHHHHHHRVTGTYIRPGDFLDIVRDNIHYISANYNSGYGRHGWQSVFFLYQQMNDDLELREFDDRQESTRLVYGIVINKRMKRITVIFRGTYGEATSDWKRNFQIDQIQVPLIVPSTVAGDTRRRWWTQTEREVDGVDPNAPTMAHVYVYRGIYEYLLQNSDRGPDYPKERYEEILGQVLQCVEEYPDFKIFVTGHSTGGALALLLSFYLARDDRIPKPVTSISVGSQVIGDVNFQHAFECLEREGLLRHLRITNEHDIIPIFPPMESYRPVGMNLHLRHTRIPHSHSKKRGRHSKQQQGFEIHHASSLRINPFTTRQGWIPGGQGWISSSVRLWSAYQEANHNIDQLIEWHNLPAYLRRLERNQSSLERLTLNECYRSRQYTGPDFETRL